MLSRTTLRLPAGMRDFAPEAAAARRRIAERSLAVFDRWGFARVITPVFEYEDVLALGLGPSGREAAIRFVEPSSGQVVALPPDITPQIARLIATRFRDEDGPVRLAYEGTVVRLDQRARSQREIIQAGVEMAGVPGPRSDAEIIALAGETLAAIGFPEVTIDLGHLGLSREVLDALELSDDDRQRVRERIAKRDRAGLTEALARSKASRDVIAFASRLPELGGPPSVVAEALALAPAKPPGIRAALRELAAVLEALEQHPIPARIHVDLAEVRGWDYYTGVRVQGYVHGAPEAILQGGRYDSLLARYGRPSPAIGFAIDVEATAVALEQAPVSEEATPSAQAGGLLISGPYDEALAAVIAARKQGRRAAAVNGDLTGDKLAAYARRWLFSEVQHVGGSAKQSAKKPGKTRRK
ncbi:MAG TPA: ATP phosphoribosyltransferase regulatory subunit [Polyangia bacterium]